MILDLLQSLIVYSTLGWGVYSLATVKSTSKYRLQTKAPVFFPLGYWLGIMLYTVIVGVRWNVGVDWESYLDLYETIKLHNETWLSKTVEYGFIFIMKVVAYYNLHYSFFFGFCGLLQVFFVALVFKDNPKAYAYAALVMIFGDYFFASMTLVRQWIPVCFFLWFSHFIVKKKPLWFLLCVCLAVSVHKTAILVLPFYLLAFDKSDWTKRKLVFLLLLGSIVLGYTTFLLNYISKSGGIALLMDYENYSARLSELTEKEQMVETAWGPVKLGKLLLQLMIIYFYPKMSYFFKSDILKLYYKLFVIGICVYYMVCNTNPLIWRPTFYFTIFMLPMTVYLLRYLYLNRKMSNYWQYYMLAFFLAIIPTYWQVLKAFMAGGENTILYQFCFNH